MTARETSEQAATLAAVQIALADLAVATTAEAQAAITRGVTHRAILALVDARRSKARWIAWLGWAIRRVLDVGSAPAYPERPEWTPSIDDLRDELDAAIAFSPDASKAYDVGRFVTYLTPDAAPEPPVAMEAIPRLDRAITESDKAADKHIDAVLTTLDKAEARAESIDEVIARLEADEAAEDARRAAEDARLKADLDRDRARTRAATEIGKAAIDAGRDLVRAGASLDRNGSIGFARVPSAGRDHHCGFCLALASNPPIRSTKMKPGEAAFHAHCGCTIAEVPSWKVFTTDPRFHESRRAHALLTEAVEADVGGDGWATTLDRYTRPARYSK